MIDESIDIKKIDDFFRICIEKDNDEGIYALRNFLGIQENSTDEELIEEIKVFMDKLASNDQLYDYFKSRCVGNINIMYLVTFLPSQKIKNYIEENLELIPEEIREELIEATKDKNYIMECIENKEKYGIGSSDIYRLIKTVNDAEFTKECLRDKEKYGITSYKARVLIESINDVEFTKECLENIEKYEFDSSDTCFLIKSIDDAEFTKKCIEDSKICEIGYNIYDLIESVNDVEFTKKCIENREAYRIDSSGIYRLIKLVNDIEFIKNCIENKEEYELDSWKIIDIIKSVNNIEFKKNCIEKREEYGLNNWEIIDIIKSANNTDFTKECIENIERYGLSKNDIPGLIKSINDVEFTKECLENIEKYGLTDSYYICSLIQAVNDTDFTKKCIENKEEYGIKGSYAICNLIKSANDIKFTKECIKNREKYELNINDISNIISIFLNEYDPKKFSEWLAFLSKEEIELPQEDMDYTMFLLDSATSKYLSQYWDSTTVKEKNKYAYSVIKGLSKDDEGIEKIFKIIDDIDPNIDKQKLLELFTIDDVDYLKQHMIKNIILDNINVKDIDVDRINEDIDKTYQIFLTNKLPENFKLLEFFKNHKNHESSNYNFYKYIDLQERDKIIESDLFRISLDSNNKQMRRFLETLYNGNIALEKRKNGEELKDIDKAIILEYRDILYDFLDVVQENNITKGENIDEDFVKLSETLNIGQDEDIGEVILTKYLNKIGFDYLKSEDKKISISLLEYMDLKKKEVQEKDKHDFKLEEGDLIKGTNFKYVKDFLEKGIRSKEFQAVGELDSDCTPLDTDFSEIKQENFKKENSETKKLEKRDLKGTISSTVSSGYGQTWLVVEKENYENNDKYISYTQGSGERSTRYFRTGIGSTCISAIITAEWKEEYKYALAQNEFYVPIIDFETEKVLFTYEEYKEIRENMRGLTHYNAENFTIDENTNNDKIIKDAQTLRKDAEGRTPTEEKRKKIIEQIRKNISKDISTEMLEDISKRHIELIDTGSTGRGTNIPGDGDFDFMLKCANKEEQAEIISELKEIIRGEEKGGSNEYNIRQTDVEIEGLDEKVEIDITSEKKSLKTVYSSDMAIRDRLDNIKALYGEEQLNKVIDNILVAKTFLKENGVYKKSISKGGTEYGGFGGIGVENWILQNGGSFIHAMQTFLENTKDENGNEVSFEEFKRKYPIYDFGQNHREGFNEHDHFIDGLSAAGFSKLKEIFQEKLKEYEISKQEQEKESFFQDIQDYTKEAKGYKMSDMTQIYGMIAQLKTKEERTGGKEHV